jgi:hypothetical protein
MLESSELTAYVVILHDQNRLSEDLSGRVKLGPVPAALSVSSTN